ncbi:MAG TPA: laccase domain-containing protein [Desulfobaccales bacterium]
MSGYLRQEAGGLVFYQSPLLAGFPELRHGFFTRQGGVSLKPYASLNLSLAVGDGRAAVEENRRRVQTVLGLDFLAGARQVHGCQDAVLSGNPGESTSEAEAADILLTPLCQCR